MKSAPFNPHSSLVTAAQLIDMLSSALAKAHAPYLSKLLIQKDGSLVKDQAIIQQVTDEPAVIDAGLILIENLLGLLVTFIGEPLMQTLVIDAWLDQTFDITHVTTEEKS